MNVVFHTLGCKLNQYETDGIAAAFAAAGHTVVPFTKLDSSAAADLAVINTCTVTSKSEQKGRRIIRNVVRRLAGAPVIITGCYAQADPLSLSRLGPNITVIGNVKKDVLTHLPSNIGAFGIEEALARLQISGEERRPFSFFDSRSTLRTRRFLKIQDGCGNRCAYCKVTIVRGDPVSLDPDEVFRRLRILEEEGAAEAVLTGINIASYSAGGLSLAQLLRKSLAETKTIRFRLSSLEPHHVTAELLDVLRDRRICPHYHLSVQSGSEHVLKRMNRPYSPSSVLSIIDELNQQDDPFIGADIITGFPGETEQQFQETLSLLTKLKLPGIHVFTFSPRPGTAAASYSGQIPQRTAKERMVMIAGMAEKWKREYTNRQTGTEREALIIGNKNGVARGLTENYMPVFIRNPAEQVISGKIVPVSIIRIDQANRLIAEYSKK
ncbi:MAG: tRNA (N(6)-L-threonylcarbamoyladenosine(37)-C(2))-methylthiotransferase MtaB [Spirochaetia bacterium]